MRPLIGPIFVLLGTLAGAQLPPLQWTPELAMRQAAEKLPSVQVARALLQSAQAYANSIGAQPNPFLRLSAIAGEPVEEANALVFRFEIAGQPGLREQSAVSSALARHDELVSEKRLVALKTGQAFYTYWEKLEVLEVSRLRTELAQTLEQSSFRRFSVGEVSQNTHLRSQLELAQAKVDEVNARIEAEQAQGMLNLLLGRSLNDPIPLALSLDAPPALPVTSISPADLQDGLLQLPELNALRHEAQAQEQQTELARRANSPDLQLQFYRNRFGPTNVQAVQLSLNIPLWDWGQVEAEVGRREGLARAAQARVTERELVLRQKALEVWKRCQAAQEKLPIYREQVTHFAKLSAGARRAYDANLMTLLEVFDVQRSHRQALQSYVTAQAELARASLELSALNPVGFFEEVSRVEP